MKTAVSALSEDKLLGELWGRYEQGYEICNREKIESESLERCCRNSLRWVQQNITQS
jgi:hypothetical protein